MTACGSSRSWIRCLSRNSSQQVDWGTARVSGRSFGQYELSTSGASDSNWNTMRWQRGLGRPREHQGPRQSLIHLGRMVKEAPTDLCKEASTPPLLTPTLQSGIAPDRILPRRRQTHQDARAQLPDSACPERRHRVGVYRLKSTSTQYDLSPTAISRLEADILLIGSEHLVHHPANLCQAQLCRRQRVQLDRPIDAFSILLHIPFHHQFLHREVAAV